MNSINNNHTKEKLKQIEKFDVKAVPYIKVMPNRKDYGLPDDPEKEIQRLHSEYKSRQSDYAIKVFLFIILLGFIIGKLITNEINGAFLYSSFSTVPAFLSYIYIGNKKPPKTKLQLSYEQFKKDIDAYYHWKEKKNLDYWLKLDGIAFEYELAELFNARGYKAILTKASGDKGLDIILEKNSDIIIVQCKAHKKRIGPNVAKELEKSMDYFGVREGIIASVSGFNQSVYEYCKGKHIRLMDIKDILGYI